MPAVNDKNSDGLDDATAETIQGLIDEAAAAEQAAKDALDKCRWAYHPNRARSS
ncbi:hypothetical protein [Psychrobacter lutiphocae]|uniref:hypothetical protein n=1 Tax=Psychrobacter lutiphocae TaxID=540500 RepID=UPI0019188795|nr:hypothetical protein [Psychrobacter lutiphocae]